MRLLVFGRSGQVATELARHMPHGANLICFGREMADISVPGAIETALAKIEVDAVVNAAAYTAVDRAEEEEALATRVNGAAPGAMARICAQRDIPFVHISTDYVFDGRGNTPWAPSDPVAPLGAYGRSKLAGEEAVTAAGGRHAILRTSWVFSAHGQNFVKTMLRLAETRDRLTVVADQIGGPTPAAAIADAAFRLVQGLSRGGASGIYHFSGAPDTSWAGFAREIFAQARNPGGQAVEIEDIPSSAYPTPARRPLNSRLDCRALERDYGISRPDWLVGLKDVLKELDT
ncbi:dTDP-4-dehydrorhamnose reductase [Rhodovulum visakhapatnamense]|uniref:dTDP-4-dehydrorhamnose reductase n=1 Tax=Rhodovulum visakhapatnamense TaxID=364297 RepID=A0A4R8FGA0_9RHOB|nr:dTDP-4-dehydrorhamnose reductase [Rhodovulum visakhapatnamense]TDX21867.1 dTDP-4-dehydrorhamnose reductase [Rhodovulum visakhapatnamense]